MKILHTSDWHLGHRLHEQSQYEEQMRFLDWLLNYVLTNYIDVLIIAGDIFDVGVPSAQAQKLYYDFLIGLHQTSCKQIIIVGGNHDAPSTINAPKELLNALSIKVVGKACDNLEDEVIELQLGDQKLIVAAVPYLRDQDIRRAVAAESSDEITNRYKTALVNHYAAVAEICKQRVDANTFVLAMGHLFAIGGKSSDSEQTIYVGNLGYIGADDFPAVFNYIALGHLHVAQKVGGKDHIRYSGSPYSLSFSEIEQTKKVLIVDTANVSDTVNVVDVVIPTFRKMLKVSGSIESCKTQLEQLSNIQHELTPWVEVILTDANEAKLGYKDIYAFSEELNLQVLKVTVQNELRLDHLRELADNSRSVNSFTPLDVFKLKCNEQNVLEPEYNDLLLAYNEILAALNEKD